MTPPVAATAAGRTATPPAPRVPRRVSGPARPRPVRAPRAGAHAAPPPIALRVAHRVRRLPDAPLLDRLIQGRAWIGIVAVALLGIVFMQVSLLKLNAGIGADVKSAQLLERSNAELRAEVSRLQSGGRIQEFAVGLGLVMPPPDGFHYLTAGRPGDAERAARSIRPPEPVEQLPAAGTSVAQGAATGSPLATQSAGTVTPPVTTASGTTASVTTASGTTASGTTASGTTASGTTVPPTNATAPAPSVPTAATTPTPSTGQP